MNIITKTGLSLSISYKAQNQVKTFELAKNGCCDLNDFDEFCDACIPDYVIGCRSIDQMVNLAGRIYRHYMQKKTMAIVPPFFKKQAIKNKMRPSNFQSLRRIGV